MSFGEWFGTFFGEPGAWPLLLLGPIGWFALRAGERVRARRLARVVGRRGEYLAADLDPRRRRARHALLAAAACFLGLSVMQPRWGDDSRRIEQRGVDVLVCLDVSRSMLARDVEPTRLGRAQAEIRALAERTRGDRMGLVVFAGDARLAVPLTQDMGSFADLVDLADPLSVSLGGTDLGVALDRALEALGGATGAHEVVLLITDGEDLEGRGLRAARACAARGVTVHAVGFGSTRGSKIAVPGESGEVFVHDRGGDDVVTAMDPESLRAIAAATGGSFVAANAVPIPLVDLYERRVLPMSRKTFGSDQGEGLANRFQLPLLAAFVLWLWRLSIGDRRRVSRQSAHGSARRATRGSADSG